MANCPGIDSPIDLTCYTVGGVKEVALGDYKLLDYDTGTGDDVRTIIGLTGSATASTFYNVMQEAESAGLNMTSVSSRENLTIHYVATLTLKFGELTPVMYDQLIKIGRAPLQAIVLSNAGKTYFLGTDSAGRQIEGNINLGVMLEDMNGATLTIEWKTTEGWYFLDRDLIGTDFVIVNPS